MTPKWDADSLVKVHSENIDRYKRNFLRQAVCELRFPTLMELGDSRPPAALVSALRKEYPHLELSNEVTLGIGSGAAGSNNAHIFRSSKRNWAVSLKKSALSIETTSYTEYAQLKERILHVVKAASKIIDSDFFTRVGIRYINIIDSGTNDPQDGWVNTNLTAPILSGYFEGVRDYAGKLQLTAEDGGCLLQHGIRWKPHAGGASEDNSPPQYMLDIDTFRNDVMVENTEAAIDSIHAQAFDVFDWAIGPKAREYLSTANAAKKTGGKI